MSPGQPIRPPKADRGRLQPTQEELLQISLRPGTNVDLVLERDDNHETVLVRRSLVHGLRGKLLVLAQVSHALGKANVGEVMEVTFLVRHYVEGLGPEWIRTGYVSRLKEVVRDFPLGEGLVEPALIFMAPKRLDLMTVRMHHRIVPPLEYAFKAMITLADQIKVSADVSALSLGGALLMHDPKWEPPYKSEFNLQLTWEGGNLELDAQVIRQSKLDAGRGRVKGTTAVKFHFGHAAQRRALSWLLADMERREIARRAAWEES